MPSSPKEEPNYRVRPVTADHWDELAEFFGPSGGTSHCWCTWWRLPSKDYTAGCGSGGEGNREVLRRLTAEGEVPGLLAYAADQPDVPLGWVSAAPRPQFGRIARSRNVKPADGDEFGDESVWALVCFWIPRTHRGRGLAKALLDGAVAYAFEHGATAVEAYPVDTGGARTQASSVFTGTVSMFRDAGFEEVLRRGENRPVMRRTAPRRSR